MKKIIIALFALLLLGTYLLPKILSTSLGKEILVRALSTKHKHISLNALSLSWLGPQEVCGVIYKDKVRHFQLDIPHAQAKTELWHLFLHKKNLKTLLITDPILLLSQQKNTTSLPLDNTSEGPTSKAVLKTIRKTTPIPFYKGNVIVKNGKIDSGSIQFSEIDAHLFLPDYSRPEKLSLTCSTLQNNIHGIVHLFAQLTEEREIDIRLSAKDLPMAGLDNLLSLEYPQAQEMLTQSIGTSLDCTLKGHLSKHSFELSLSAHSPKLFAELHTKKEQGEITFLSPATFSLSLSPEFLEHLITFADLPHLSFHEPSELHIKIPTFRLPKQPNGLDLTKAAFDAHLSLAPTRFTLSALQKTIDLNALTARFKSEGLLDAFQAHVDFKFAHLGKEGSASISSEHASLKKGDATLSILNFPTALLDKKHHLALFLGNTINLSAFAEWDTALSSLQFSLETPHLHIPQTTLSCTPDLLLDAPITLTYHPPKAVFDYLKLHPTFPLLTLGTLTCSIDELRIPKQTLLHAITFKGELKADGLSLFIKDPTHILPLPELTCQLSAKTLANLHAEIESANLNTELFASVPESLDSLSINKTVHLKYLLTDSLFPHPHLKVPTLADIALSPFTLPKPLIKAEGSIPSITFTHNNTSATFENLAFKLNKHTLDLSAKHNEGSIDLTCKFSPRLTGKGRLKHIHPDAIQTLAALDHSLLPIFGSPLDLTFEVEEKEKEQHCFVDATSEHLKLSASFIRMPDHTIQTNEAAKVDWTITPEAFAQLQGNSPFTLTKNTSLKLNIKKLTLTPLFAQSEMEGDFHIGTLSIQEITLKELKGSVTKEKEAPLHLSLHGKAAPQGELNITGSLNNLSCEIRQFPTPILDLFARPFLHTRLHLHSLLGNQVGATLTTKEGAIHLSLHSDNAKAALSGHLTNGLLTLSEPLHAQFHITSDFSTHLLKKTNPLAITSFSSKDPVTLEIAPQGFSLPLFPLDPSKATIPHARLELGQITCAGRGHLKSVLKLLKNPDLASDNTLALWFTPADLHINQGVIDLERTDILIQNALPIALWGTLDYPSDHVNMTLGLTKPTLQKAFHIKHLPDAYVLHIPLTGSINDISIDKTLATNKIATLMAWQLASKGNGDIFDNLLGSVATLPDQNANTPPSKKPIPWEKKQKSPKKTKQKTASRKPPGPRTTERKNPNPLKELFKAVK